MDRRIIFFLVFTITLLCTILVAVVCFLTEQSMMDTAIYSLTSMWIMGIVTQLMLSNLYRAVVQPLEEERASVQEKRQVELDLDDIEGIDELATMDSGLSSQIRSEPELNAPQPRREYKG